MHIRKDNLSIAQNRGKHVVEVVGYTACEPSHNLHLLGLEELVLHLQLFGDVPCDTDHSHRVTFLILQHERRHQGRKNRTIFLYMP